MKKHLVIYHSADMDGICSAAIFKSYFEHERFEKDEVVYFGMNYRDEFDWSLVDKDTNVYMADFSFQPFEDMIKLANNCNMLIWIDHHKSAIDNYNNTKTPINFIAYNKIDPGLGACASVWEFCFNSKPPTAVRLMAEYDVWKHDDPKCLPFQYGIRNYKEQLLNDMHFRNAIFSNDFEVVGHVVSNGKAIQSYINTQHEIISSKAYPMEFEGYKWATVNNTIHSSMQLDFVPNIEGYDGMCVFHWDGKKKEWNVSLYSPQKKVDCSIIAKKYGGGGHAGAAGFSTKINFFE